MDLFTPFLYVSLTLFVLDSLPLFASFLFNAFAIRHQALPLLLTLCLLLHLDKTFIPTLSLIIVALTVGLHCEFGKEE